VTTIKRSALLVLLGTACTAHAAEPAALGSGRVLVRLAPGSDAAELAAATGADALDEVVTREPLRVVLRGRAPADALRLAAALAASPVVEYAVAERWLPMELRSHVPNDPLFGEQWALENTGQGSERGAPITGADVDATAAWAYTLGAPDVLIAVLDDGVQLDHPDLAPNIVGPGRDFTTAAPSAATPKAATDRHGTSVAGVAAARGDNGIGVSGICPRCRILPIRVHGSSNLGTAAAFRYAVEQGADVITNSWGYTSAVPYAADDAVRDAIDSAAREGRSGRGAVVVFGMTNESVDNCGGERADISSLDSVIAVGVANHRDEVGGSGFGPCLDLVAPAKPRDRGTVGIVTTDRTGVDGHTADDYYAGFGGTSAAAPLVAGVAGLLLSLNPDLRRADVQRILEHTADKIDVAHVAYDERGFSERAGYGRVNAARALVPFVAILVTPATVAAGEPFSVTVSASAPFGLESVWWSGEGTGDAALDRPHRRELAGEFYESATWSNLVLDEPGVFTLTADAQDVRHADGASGYPHRAGERTPVPTAKLTVIERSDGLSR
jgi:subtilisin family serine protease